MSGTQTQRRTHVDWRDKCFPISGAPVAVESISDLGWNALRHLETPVVVLKESAVRHNIALMAQYCLDHSVLLAPHGKTTMAPQIFRWQLEAGAWAISAATMSQVRVMRRTGINRVLLANQVVDEASLSWLVQELNDDPGFDFLCLADSLEGVRRLRDKAALLRDGRSIGVLVEVGSEGGRSGCRTLEQAHAVAAEVAGSSGLELRGVEAYEGLIVSEDGAAELLAFLAHARSVFESLAARGFFGERETAILSAGGSAYFDHVVEAFATAGGAVRPKVVLRSGCYVTHDSGTYERQSPLAGRQRPGGTRLRTGLEAWASVISVPEPTRAILGIGKRDVSYDHHLPSVASRTRPGALRQDIRGRVRSLQIDDQHLHVRPDPDVELRVGDLVSLDLSHPCTTLDKWRLLPMVDDDYVIRGVVETLF